ncbi:ABC transporter permease [Corticibacter populi]|uniref:ABC transporter permease n=1 Tax=Corticibacter populi TaxID=1550736 RepID=A0A3M6R0J1_9BURK|nr:ABC transporter permease [Corticibacter populi]RMX08774.1 ABC transporter permease [Corticibacter populi]RZS36133.1 phospholipid/cholesterol/gamma-HCH transport system permease protein [Corticibacter populi]
MRIASPSQDFARHLHEWWLLWWNNLYLGCAMLVLLAYPSSHRPAVWRLVMRRVYERLHWPLLLFVAIGGLTSTVITQIVAQTLFSYGLLHTTAALLIRTILVELVPIAAALVVAIKLTIPLGAELATLRHKRHFEQLAAAGADALRVEFLPRLLMGIYAAVMFAVCGSAIVLLTIYLGIYGYTTAGLPVFTHAFGRTMTPLYGAIFAAKAIAFGFVVALIPLTTAFYDARYGLRSDSELATLARLLAILALVEVVSLVANYY